MNFTPSISKEEVSQLPLFTFQGKIHLIEKIEDLGPALRTLKKQDYLGFDTEKKPTFQKGAYHPTALLQLSTPEEAFLIRINKIGIPPSLISLLENDEIKKIGVGIRDDVIDLQKVKKFRPGGFMELINITKELGIESSGVRNLSGIFLKQRISKNQQTSNWENSSLTQAQLLYAAADAWVPLEIFRMLNEKGFVYDD